MESMPARGNGIHLVVPARTDSIAIARQLVAGVGDALELDELEVADLKLVVSEACSNAVRYAYPSGAEEEEGLGASGPVEVSVDGAEDMVTVTVRDHGFGFALAAPNEESLGLGIPMMASVCDRLELRTADGGGVEVTAEVAVGESRRERRERPDPSQRLTSPPVLGDEVAQLTLTGGMALRPILARLIGICALRSGLTIDQLADSLLVSDAVSAGDIWAEQTRIKLVEEESYARLTIGPLANGGGKKLLDGLEIPGVGSVTKLASEISVDDRPEADPAGEYLTMTVTGSAA